VAFLLGDAVHGRRGVTYMASESTNGDPNEPDDFDGETEPSEDMGLDLIQLNLRTVVVQVRRAFNDWRCIFFSSDKRDPDIYALAGLSHCCMLLEELDRLRQEENLLVGFLVARACIETWLTASYMFLQGEQGVAEVKGAFASATRTQVDKLVATEARNKRDYERAVAAKEAAEKHNTGIRAKNEREGTDIPLRTVPPLPPRRHDVSLGSEFLLERVADIGDAQITLETMAQRLGPLAKAAGVGGGDWTELYDIAYRSTSAYGAHPTWFVFESYIDPDYRMKHVRPDPPKSEVLGHATMDVVQLVAILGAQVLSKFGLDVQLLRDVDAWWSWMKAQMLAAREEAAPSR